MNNHFANVCRQSSRRPSNPAPSSSPNALGDSAATFDSLCSVSEAAPVSDAHAVLLDHHVYNEFCKAWEKRASDPQPFIDVTIQAVPSHAHSLGFHTSLKTPTHPVTYPMMADTGCQSCLAGTGHQVGAGPATPPSCQHEDDSSKSRSYRHHWSPSPPDFRHIPIQNHA